MKSVFPLLAEALAAIDIEQKLALTAALVRDWHTGLLDWQNSEAVPLLVGRPARPELLAPRDMPERNPKSMAGRASLLHAIVHIEFSAINLALDHAARFRGLPKAYYSDWIGVAAEEAEHFSLLRQRLRQFGYDYGDFPAHAGLWEMAEKTAHDPLARMALVPRLLEARGLDATPVIQSRLRGAGDEPTAGLLDLILRDEIGHVGLGDRWFRHFCRERRLEPESTFRELLDEYRAPWPGSQMNAEARIQAGFSRSELAALVKRKI